MSSPFEPALRRILWELRLYLTDVVIIGGWVPYLYRQYGGFPDWKGNLSLTAEVDVLVRPIAPNTRPSLKDLLQASGFQPIEGTNGAAWQSNPNAGEKLEFLIVNEGMQSMEGTVQPVPGQAGVAAVALDDLRLIGKYTTSLIIPISVANGSREALTIQLPTLGAYVLNKATTFVKRQRHVENNLTIENPKRAKDLLYIHDVFAGGQEVAHRVARDLKAMGKKDAYARTQMRSAADRLDLTIKDPQSTLMTECVRMMMERDGYSEADARGRLMGYLTDAAEVLRAAAK